MVELEQRHLVGIVFQAAVSMIPLVHVMEVLAGMK